MFHGELYLPKNRKSTKQKTSKKHTESHRSWLLSSPLFPQRKYPHHLNEPSLGSSFFLPLEATIPPLLSWPTTKTSLPHRFVLSFKQRRSGKSCFCEFTDTINKWECCGYTYPPLNSKSDLNADFGRIPPLMYLSSWPTVGLVAIKIGQSDTVARQNPAISRSFGWKRLKLHKYLAVWPSHWCFVHQQYCWWKKSCTA